MIWTLTRQKIVGSFALFISLVGSSLAQSITVSNNISPSTALCDRGNVSLTFSTSGTFTAGNVFSLQRSDENGIFPTTPIVSGTLAAAPTSATTLTVSGTLDAGAVFGLNYRFRVVSSAPVRTSNGPTPSPATIGRPGAPSVNGVVNGSGSYCPAATNQLTATGFAGATFRWSNNRGLPDQAGSSIDIPDQTTTYTVRQSVGGCESSNAAQFTATINPAPDKPTLTNRTLSYCSGATAPSLQVTNVGSGNTVIWTLPNSTTSTSNPLTGTLAGQYSVVQRNTATGCTSAAETAVVTVNQTPALPSLNSGGPFCQFTGANNVQTITANGSNLEWYASAAGGTVINTGSSFTVSTASASPDPVVYLRQTVNGCPSSIATILVVINPTPAAPTAISFPNNYCASDAGGQSRLSVTLSGGATSVKWYNLTDNTTSTDATLAAPGSPKRYQVTQSINGCESGRSAEFTVNVKRNPDAPTLTGETTFCQNSGVQTITAQGEANSTIEWFANASTANVSATGTSFTVSTAVADPDPVVYFQQRVDGCASTPRTSRSITVNPTPGRPSVSSSYAACQNATAGTLSSAVTNGQGLRFFEGNTERAGSYRPATSTTGNSTTFAVTQTINGCEGPAETLTLTVYGLPPQPTVGTTYNYCQSDAPASLTAGGNNIRWYNQNGGFLGSNTIAAPTGPNAYVFRVTQTDGRNCQSEFLNVPVQVRATPAAPGVQNPIFCQTRAAQQLTAAGENLKWFDGAGNLLANAPTPSTTTLGQQQRYFVNQTNAVGCTSTTALVTVTVNAIPANPTFTQPRAYCAGEPADLLVGNGTALRWYDAPTGGNGSPTAIRPSTDNNPTSQAPTTTQSYYITQTVASCESERQKIDVTIKRRPDQPTGITNKEFCQNYAPPALTATPEANASIVWFVNGNYVPTAPVPLSTVVGTTTYRVAQTLNECRGADATLTVRVKSTPGQPTITPFSLCQGRGTRTLQANGTDLKYYDASNNLIGTTAPSPSTDQATTITYKVSQSTDGCEGPKIDYPVIVYPIPGQPGVSNLTYCLTQTDQPAQDVRPLTAAGQNLRWYNTDNNSFPSAPTPNINALIDATYLVTQTVNNCESERARLNVRVVTTPTPTVPASVLTYCRNDPSSPIVVTAPTGSTLVWTGPDGFTFPQVPGGQGPTPPTINATKGGEQYRVYAIGTNGCYSARAFIGLVVNTNPTATISGSTTVNYGQTATLRLRFTSQPPFSYTLTDGTTGTATDTLTNVVVKPLQTTLYQVASVSNVCGGGQPVSSANVFVTIPTITTQALTGSNTVCANTSFVVGYGTTGTFNQGNGFKVQIADTTSKNYIDVSGVTPGNPITANLPANLRGGPYFVRVLATNPGAEVPGQLSPTVLTVKGLPGATLRGTQDVYETYPASLTIALTGDGPWAVTYQATDGQPVSFNTSANPHVLTVQPAKTTTYQLLSVANNCASTTALSGTAVVTVLPLLAVENPLTGALSIFPIPTQNVLTVAIDLPLSPQQPAELTLNDLTGRPVLTRTTEARQTQLDLSQQPAGLYLLNVQVGDKRAVRKVMKL